MDALNWAFLSATSGEMLLRCYVERSRAFRSGWHCMDAVVLCLSIAAEAAVLLIGSGLLLASVFRVLRVSRLLRFLHTLERLSFFRQLRKLIQMFASCLQTLFWSFCLTLLVMTMWANVAVVLLHPLVAELQSQGAWPDCQSCGRSFASVMRANLTLFQIIVASDSWGEVAVPLIETHPWTAVVFVGALWTLIFGMLNLMVAVVVDTFAEARENDLKDRSRELAQLEAREREALDRIFRRIDQGDTGCVTFADLRRGAEAVPEFKQRLRVMDVGLRDLQQLFSMIDEDPDLQRPQQNSTHVLHSFRPLEAASVVTREPCGAIVSTGARASSSTQQRGPIEIRRPR
ncbi:unnamed protein product [Prorocentrum cordatum]|uniref:EF-hand domain-containing protein n=1 Tax=Prorocentrum cordatum TaxID=2364126 RepID=A0ABN9TAN2_9DINO|nr:unnamed protein product [Polarella glacialis]